jgi:hypothetical protein
MLKHGESSSHQHPSSSRISLSSSTDHDSLNSLIPMAHGLICPETIENLGKENSVVKKFVETYHKNGPLACEDMLSDPKILPHLTKAMRDIA